MSILFDLLKKRGVESSADLSVEEKADFDRWERILSEGEMTLDRIKTFCESQINIIEGKFADLDNSNQKNDRLIIQHNIYKTLIKVISSPQVERENLEKYLKTLL